jgi:hypothetical protein
MAPDSIWLATTNGRGAYWDVAIAGALWDIYDARDDNQNGDPWGDRFSDGPLLVWQALSGASDSVRNVCDAQNQFAAQFNDPYTESLRSELSREVFREHGILCKITGTPIVPITGVRNQDGAPVVRLRVGPNPASGAIQVRLDVSGTVPPEEAVLRIVDVQGRLVRTLYRNRLRSGALGAVWDGKTDTGANCASGVYYCLLRVGDLDRRAKVVLLK